MMMKNPHSKDIIIETTKILKDDSLTDKPSDFVGSLSDEENGDAMIHHIQDEIFLKANTAATRYSIAFNKKKRAIQFRVWFDKEFKVEAEITLDECVRFFCDHDFKPVWQSKHTGELLRSNRTLRCECGETKEI